MENQVVNNVFVNKVVYKLYLWKNIMKMVINLVMCTTNGYIIHVTPMTYVFSNRSKYHLKLQYLVYFYGQA